ncbi:hypothetical protein Nmel_016371, partial [Mimus melanotis]
QEGLLDLGQPGHAVSPVPGRAPRQGAAPGRAGAATAAGQQHGQQESIAWIAAWSAGEHCMDSSTVSR